MTSAAYITPEGGMYDGPLRCSILGDKLCCAGIS